MIESYPHYINDWRTSEAVLSMTAEQRDVYRELLDMCWLYGSLPTDETTLRSMSLANEKEWKRSWPAVKAKFTERDGRLWNDKVDEKRPQILEQKEARRRAAQSTNAKRDAERYGDRHGECAQSDTPSERYARGRSPSTVLPSKKSGDTYSSIADGTPPPAADDPERFAYVRDSLHGFFDGLRGYPDDDIVNRILNASRGHPIAEVGEVFRELWMRKKKPESWGFFPVVVEKRFNGGAS